LCDPGLPFQSAAPAFWLLAGDFRFLFGILRLLFAVSMNDIDIEALKGVAQQLRIHSIEATTAAGSGHPTSCCSAADVVAALFFGHMRYDPKNSHPLQRPCRALAVCRLGGNGAVSSGGVAQAAPVRQ
jgi:hypothetical protein